jgi:hypothetical protein
MTGGSLEKNERVEREHCQMRRQSGRIAQRLRLPSLFTQVFLLPYQASLTSMLSGYARRENPANVGIAQHP